MDNKCSWGLDAYPYQNHIYVTYSAYIYMWHICDIYVKYITHICDIYVSYITHVCYIYVKCRYLEPICSYLHICHTYVDICDIYVVNSIAYTGQIYVTYMWHIFEKNWLGTYQLRLLYFEVNCYRYTCSTYIYLLISYIFNKYITPFFFHWNNCILVINSSYTLAVLKLKTYIILTD